jgi:hypothetical protein
MYSNADWVKTRSGPNSLFGGLRMHYTIAVNCAPPAKKNRDSCVKLKTWPHTLIQRLRRFLLNRFRSGPVSIATNVERFVCAIDRGLRSQLRLHGYYNFVLCNGLPSLIAVPMPCLPQATPEIKSCWHTIGSVLCCVRKLPIPAYMQLFSTVEYGCAASD